MTTSISDNMYYTTICKLASEDENCFNTFKLNPSYTAILEHTTYEQGKEYLNEIKKYIKDNSTLSALINQSQINDIFGGAQTVEYIIDDQSIMISPSTLRYLSVAVDMIKKFGSFSNKSVCEIGGGYGGQCTVMNAISGFATWHIVDLPEANLLQQKYLSTNNIKNVNVYNLSTIDKLFEKYDVVISNYAFSECKKQIQDIYMQKIISKATNGYMLMNFCWDDESHGKGWQKQNGYENMMTEMEFKKYIPTLNIEKEVPETHPKNKLYFW